MSKANMLEEEEETFQSVVVLWGSIFTRTEMHINILNKYITTKL